MFFSSTRFVARHGKGDPGWNVRARNVCARAKRNVCARAKRDVRDREQANLRFRLAEI
jgi:hypothetical protein